MKLLRKLFSYLVFKLKALNLIDTSDLYDVQIMNAYKQLLLDYNDLTDRMESLKQRAISYQDYITELEANKRKAEEARREANLLLANRAFQQALKAHPEIWNK